MDTDQSNQQQLIMPPAAAAPQAHVNLYNIVKESLIGNLSIENLIQQLTELSKNAANKDDFVGLLADVIVQCDLESSLCIKDQRDSLYLIIKAIVSDNLITPIIAHERLDIDTNVHLGIIPDKRQFTVNYNRLRTKLYFKQRKYNLMREQSEGFAKVITELAQLEESNAGEVLSNVLQLIGRYRVDPNRVLDLILSVFEFNARYNCSDLYINFIKAFYDNPSKLTQLIALRLTLYTSTKDEFRIVPQSFYRLLAILISREIIDIDDIYPYLLPDDAKILNYHNKLVAEAKELSRSYAMALVGEEKPSKTVIETLKDENPLDYHNLEVDNRKINLCAHLISIGDWERALGLARKLPEFYCFSHPRVAETLCDYLHFLIDVLYRECALPKPLNSKIRPILSNQQGFNEIQVTTIEQLQERVFPILLAIGPFIGTDTLLLTKMIRILRYIVLEKNFGSNHQQHANNNNSTLNNAAINSTTTPDDNLYYQVLDVISYSILPATSLTVSNSCLARELWTLIKNFKYHIRYKLYHEWKEEGSNPIMLRNRGQILLRAKHHMKRLSKETLRPSGRNLGKLCYSNPVITLNYILIQIQSYDNLIGMVVDAFRFLPSIALDTLIYCILEALSDTQRNKKSSDGMALAPWLTSLSNFSSQIILRFKVEFVSFLEYIAIQLKVGNSLDLVLLTDLIQKMTGIETLQTSTDDRIEALMGGDVLRVEGAYFNQVKNTRKSSARLKDALIESRLAMPLCILMAQIRDNLFFNPKEQHDGTPLKLIGKLYDQCQETLAQYGVFLSMNLSIDDYVNFLPSLEKLMTEHKLDPDSAFFLARPMIIYRIKSQFQEMKAAALKDIRITQEGEIPELSPQTVSIKFVEAARSVIDSLSESIQPLLAEKCSSCNLNSKLFVIFWTFSMSDIYVPTNCYEREINRLKTIIADLDKTAETPKARKERDRCSSLIVKLKQEKNEQEQHTTLIQTYLEAEKNSLFCGTASYDNVYLESRQFVQHCVLARCILSACDAIYCARFMLYLHELKVDNYPTIICLDRLLCDLTYMMGACTENEVSHYGRFLSIILKTTSLWHSSQEVYIKQCEDHPGSIINVDNSESISYECYRDICYKWHYRLTRSFSVALESNNYIQIRNALIVMIRIIEYYPSIKHFGKGIGIKIEEVRANERDNRQDLFALATAYAGRLDERKPHLIPEGNFHAVDSTKSAQKEKHSSSSSRKRARHS